METSWKTWISVLLAIVLAVQMVPMSAFATDGDEILIVGDWEEENGDDDIPIIETGDEDEIKLADYEGEELSSNGKKTYRAEDVLWENQNLREQGVKHFHLSDGTDVAILYEQPVHYLDSTGVFQNIDNSLELVERGKERTEPEPVVAVEGNDEAPVDEASAYDDGEIIIVDTDPVVDDQANATEEETLVPEKESAEDRSGEEPLGNEYRNRAGLFDVRLAELANANGLVRISDEKYTMSFTPAWDIEERPAALLESEPSYDSESFEAAVTPQNLTAGLRYDEVLPGVDLEYWVHPSGLKENIVLREPMGEAAFPFILDCGELMAYCDEDGNIALCEQEGECVMRIPAGYMMDAEGAFSEEVSYELEELGEGEYLLTIRADDAWLNEEGRAYPVNIDPAVTVAAYDHNSGLSSNYAKSNLSSPEGINRVLYCGYGYNTDYKRFLEYRAMLGFDQLPNLPANCMVVGSLLFLDQPPIGYSGNPTDYCIHQVNMSLPSGCNDYADWIDNHLVWSHTTGSNISNEVLDYITASQSTNGTTFECDVTRAVKSWYCDSSVPHVFCIKRPDTTSDAWLAIQGYEPSAHIGPALSVYYRNTVGLEDYYSYQSHSIDRAGTGYIGDYTGQLTLVKTDATSASTVCPVTVSHVYNSAYCSGQIGSAAPGASGYSNMNVGQGWKLNIQQSVAVDNESYLEYMDADGTIHYFYRTATNTYKDEDGLNLTITADGTNYTMTDRYDNIQYFLGGLLSYSQDANGNRITYNRDGSNRVTSVTRTLNGSSAETIATLSYSGNYLSSITDSAGNVTSFTYSNGTLTTITHPDGTTASYTYDSNENNSNRRMLTAKDNESSYSMTYTYNGQGRISGYTEKAGSTVGASVDVSGSVGVRTYRYCGADRTLGSSDDLITSYVFDYFGRTITGSTTDSTGTVTYSAFGGKYKNNEGTYGDNNRLEIGSSVGIRPVGNTGNYDTYHDNMLTSPDLTNENGFSLAGSTTQNQCITETLFADASDLRKPSTSAAQTYMFSGWAKAASVPMKEDSGRSFELRATINYTDNSSETQSVSFCTDSTEWQYAVLPIVPCYPNKTVASLTVGFHYDHNANSAQFKLGCLTKESVAAYTWTADGDLESVVSPGNASQNYTYDPDNGVDLIQQITKGNGVFNYTYDNSHNVLSAENDGILTAFSYDNAGNTVSTTTTGGGLTMGSTATYTNNGNLLASQTDTRGKTTSYTYGNAISKQLGQPTAVTDPKSVTVNTSYNTQNGRVTGSSMTGASLAYTYGSGRLTAMTRTNYLINQTYNMAYNGFGQLTTVKVGTRNLASYSYAPSNGVLTALTYGNGNTVVYGYDDLERVTHVYYNNSSSPAYTYTYYGEGTLQRLTDSANNRTYEYEYDSLNRLKALTEKYNGSNVQTYSMDHDGANRVTSSTYNVSPSWNGTVGSARTYTYSYSPDNGSLTAMTGPSASMAYTYDGLRRLTRRVVSSGSNEVIRRDYTYLPGSGSNTSNLVRKLVSKHGNTTLSELTYSYDNVGNITAVSYPSNTWLSETIHYTYNDQNQLVEEQYPLGNHNHTVSYLFDKAGNLSERVDTYPTGFISIPTTMPTPTPDIPNAEGGGDGTNGGPGPIDGIQYETVTDTFTYGNSEWPDLLTAYNGNTITYDTIGNPTQWYDGATMTWVNGRRLASISATSDHAALAFTYDADGLRLTKTVGSGSSAVQHKYTWLGGKLIAEQYGNNTLEFFYDESGSPYAFSYNGTVYYYVTNLQGDIVMIVNANGTSKASYTYDAFGNLLSSSGTMANINPLRYRGYYYDAETGFYYLKSRYYDPAICRFINADGLASTGQGFLGCNMFSYCRNNPICRIDSDGQIDTYCVTAQNTEYLGKGENNKELYVTTIKYTHDYFDDSGLTTGSYSEEINVEIRFSIDSAGFVSIPNAAVEQNALAINCVCNALAEEIYHINSSKLQGRTVKGISREIYLHYLAFSIPLMNKLTDDFISTDVGSTLSGTSNEDHNAMGFEYLYLLPGILLETIISKLPD